MSAISWNETTPSPSSDASSGDDELRSFMTNVALGLQPSFYWPGSGGGSAASAGQSQPGNLRMVRSNSVATRADEGWLQLMPQRVAVEYIGSWKGPLGHAGMLAMSSSTTAGGGLAWPQASRWVMQTGNFIPTSSGSSFTQAISFSSTYLGTPTFVSIAQLDDGFGGLAANGARYVVGIQAGSVTSTGFTAIVSSVVSSAIVPSSPGIGWFSLGTASF